MKKIINIVEDEKDLNELVKSYLEKEGYTVKVATKTGFITQVNPKRKIAESALSAAKALAVEFGMTPSSRNRVAALLSGNAPKDDFADFEEVDVQ